MADFRSISALKRWSTENHTYAKLNLPTAELYKRCEGTLVRGHGPGDRDLNPTSGTQAPGPPPPGSLFSYLNGFSEKALGKVPRQSMA